jgi:hypothetical protein
MHVITDSRVQKTVPHTVRNGAQANPCPLPARPPFGASTISLEARRRLRMFRQSASLPYERPVMPPVATVAMMELSADWRSGRWRPAARRSRRRTTCAAHRGRSLMQPLEDGASAVAVLHAGRGHHDHQQQPPGRRGVNAAHKPENSSGQPPCFPRSCGFQARAGERRSQ